MEITAHKERYIYPEERQRIIEELKLLPKTDVYNYSIIDKLMSILKKFISPEKKTQQIIDKLRLV